jgi:hypothetical protein
MMILYYFLIALIVKGCCLLLDMLELLEMICLDLRALFDHFRGWKDMDMDLTLVL